jgi:hypothetical protein
MIYDIGAINQYLSVLENRFNVATKKNIDKVREHIIKIANDKNQTANYKIICSNTSYSPTSYYGRTIDRAMKCPIYQHGDLMDNQLHTKKSNNTLLGEERVRQYNVRLCISLSYIYYLFTKLDIRNDMTRNNILHFNTLCKIQRRLLPTKIRPAMLFDHIYSKTNGFNWEWLLIGCIVPPIEIQTLISSSETWNDMTKTLKLHLHYYAIETPKSEKNEPDIFKVPDMYDDEHDVIVV